MKALRSFTVRPRLPESLAPLQDLAMNLRWSWDERTRDLFRWVDPDRWEVTGHDPVSLLGHVRRERLESLAADPAFMSFLGEVHGDLGRYLQSDRWFQNRPAGALRHVAYFSPEFGIAEALPQYSGGLGVLAGDHLKAASGLGIPLVGIGLFYRQGYFRQTLNGDGWQQERYPKLDPHAMAVRLVEGARVEVDLAGVALHAQVWRADVGRVPLFLLDADIDDNDTEARLVTDRLYGGQTEHRIRQEILLGIGGVRALDALGETPQVFHTNEGHAGFLGLERIGRLMRGDGLSFAEAIEAVRSATVFTTHTPVPAGIDRFPRELMERYFKGWADDCGIGFDQLMSLGHFPGEDVSAPFNMAVMGLRLAGLSNGVAKLHGATSRRMFQGLWPGVPVDEVPITSVTNGVHAGTWTSPEMNDLLTRYVMPGWHEADAAQWSRIADARDDEVWRVLEQGRDHLVAFARNRLKASVLSRGASESDAAWTDDVLDPRILTIGFARRFATYKRADLLLSHPERLKALLLSADRPLQLVFAGKAHPADDKGKEIIRRIVQFSRDPEIRHRFVFIEDYDISVARTMLQGCDVWLNNPRRPEEACGTSGEKAALNGGLNCSILDGWWDEMFDGTNGWAISSAESYEDLARRDEVEAASLFDILERQVVPLFYERSLGPVPRRWVERVKSSLQTLGPKVLASRMVRDYVEQLYEPIAGQAATMGESSFASARALSAWKQRVLAGWHGVTVVDVDAEAAVADLGTTRRVEAVVSLGQLSRDDVAVQLVHGPVGPSDEMAGTSIATMTLESEGPADGGHAGRSTYAGSFSCETPGRYGYTVRVVPANAHLLTPAEMGCITWA
ncbi:MAG: Glycogen phosphorylase [uncultured Acidimicrobiales bacterium]|uniref:Glycogen phosphorylase n=1 Tax=uncultured Acidimicrobiales bacterium TaxID=310071 RepID=A0A6J4GZZ6_9ACTN|nr:MAG: Glycogen phosphorylase [uncultured Acidimicrobiales bacterium]